MAVSDGGRFPKDMYVYKYIYIYTYTYTYIYIYIYIFASIYTCMHTCVWYVCVLLGLRLRLLLLMSRIREHVFLQKYWVMGTRGNRES